MEICHITTVHKINDTRILYKEIQSLLNDGFKVNYVVKKDDVPFENPNLKYHFLENTSGSINRIKRNFKAYQIAARTDSQIYHFHDPELIFVGYFLKIFKKKKVVYDIHEIYKDAILHKSYIPFYLRKFLSLIYDIVEKLTIRRFDYLILAEDNYKNFYKTYKYSIVENYISKKLIVSDYNKNFSKIEFAYVGGITEIRGVWEMLNLVKMLANELDIHLHLVGYYYPENLKNKVLTFIEKNKLQTKITVYDRLPYPEAQKIVQKCNVGLVLLHKIDNYVNTLPTKFFEYMAAGLVVIMSDFETWKNFNKIYNIGLPLNIDRLIEHKTKLIDFFKDSQTLTKISESNRIAVKEKFTWESQYAKLKDVYLLIDQQ